MYPKVLIYIQTCVIREFGATLESYDSKARFGKISSTSKKKDWFFGRVISHRVAAITECGQLGNDVNRNPEVVAIGQTLLNIPFPNPVIPPTSPATYCLVEDPFDRYQDPPG